MNKIIILVLTFFISTVSFCQKIETVYLDQKDSTTNMYIAVVPQNGQVNSFMFLLEGFGNYSPQNLPLETDLPKYAAQQNILTIIPILKTGPLYFGSISDFEYQQFGLKTDRFSFSDFIDIVSRELSRQNLAKMVELAERYGLSSMSMDEISEEVKAVRNKNAAHS